MALINCPECDKQISDKAKACPNCGFPIEEMNKPNELPLQIPELPSDLSTGKPITNWAGNTHFKGVYDSQENVVDKIQPGVVHVTMHENGIVISGGLFLNPYPIHNSQIINLKQISRTELGSLNKDVVGRAVVGALIYGPAGAVIGALTAKRQHSQHYLIINYWDIDVRNAQSLIIGGSKMLVNAFIKRYEEEVTLKTQNQESYKLIISELQEVTSEARINPTEIQDSELAKWKTGFIQIGWLEEIGQNTQMALSKSANDYRISKDTLLCVSYADIKGSHITDLSFNQINIFSSFLALIATSQTLVFVRPDKKFVQVLEYKDINKIEGSKKFNSKTYSIISKSGDSATLTVDYKNTEDENIVDLFFERIVLVN